MRISDWSSDVCSSDLESQPPVESRLSHRRIQAQMTTHYRQLTQGQRYQIEAGLSAAESQASIAKRVGVHPSTISSEVRRNRSEGRRVGKECVSAWTSRWWRWQEKKKKETTNKK